jgi:hypothetical protein
MLLIYVGSSPENLPRVYMWSMRRLCRRLAPPMLIAPPHPSHPLDDQPGTCRDRYEVRQPPCTSRIGTAPNSKRRALLPFPEYNTLCMSSPRRRQRRTSHTFPIKQHHPPPLPLKTLSVVMKVHKWRCPVAGPANSRAGKAVHNDVAPTRGCFFIMGIRTYIFKFSAALSVNFMPVRSHNRCGTVL